MGLIQSYYTVMGWGAVLVLAFLLADCVGGAVVWVLRRFGWLPWWLDPDEEDNEIQEKPCARAVRRSEEKAEKDCTWPCGCVKIISDKR